MTASSAAAPAEAARAGRTTAAIVAVVAGGAFLAPINSTMIAVALPSLADQYRYRGRRRRVARHRVPARDGERAAVRRTARRLVRPPEALRRRLRRSPRGVSRLRPGALVRRAARLSIPSGAGNGCDRPKRRRHPPARRSRRTPGASVRVVRRLHDGGGRHRACRRRVPHRPVWLRLDLLDQPPDTRGGPAACAATASRDADGSVTPLDGIGAVLLTSTLVAGASAFVFARSVGVAVSAALGGATVVLAFAFVRWERRHPRPLVDLRLFRHPAFSAACASVLLSNLIMYTTLLLIPVLLTELQGKGANDVGWVLVVFSGSMALVSPIGGRLSDRVGRALPVVLGVCCSLRAPPCFSVWTPRPRLRRCCSHWSSSVSASVCRWGRSKLPHSSLRRRA